MTTPKTANYFQTKSIFLSGLGIGLLVGSLSAASGRYHVPWQFWAGIGLVLIAFILQIIGARKEVAASREAANKELYDKNSR